MSVSDMYRAVAELAYAVAKADGGMQSVEKEEFYRIMQEDLYPNGALAESRFELLEEMGTLTVDQAYKTSMMTLKMNKHLLTPEMRGIFLHVMEKIAKAYNGIESSELELIERFVRDLDLLDGKKK
ncbi:MAG: TerB family tellurite resistance protein [Bacteroidota bacterium]